jgi:phage gp45-like
MIANVNDLRSFILRTMRQFIGELRDMVRLGKVSKISEGDDVQVMQALDMRGRAEDDVVNLNHYGISAHPPAGSKGVMLSLQANSDESVMLCACPPKRPAVESGEVIVWSVHDQRIALNKDGEVTIACKENGGMVSLKPDGSIAIDAKSGASVRIDAAGAITLTSPGANLIKLGSDSASLGVARQTDAVAPSVQAIAYHTFCEGLFNSLLPGTFTGANTYAAVVLTAGQISQASTRVKSL